MKRVKEWLGCRFGFHRFGPWTWDDKPRLVVEGLMPEYLQRRACLDCLKTQGPLQSSEERHYWESWRDR